MSQENKWMWVWGISWRVGGAEFGLSILSSPGRGQGRRPLRRAERDVRLWHSVSPMRAWNVTGSGRKAPEETLTTQGGVGTAGVDPLVEAVDPLLKAEKRKGFLWGFRLTAVNLPWASKNLTNFDRICTVEKWNSFDVSCKLKQTTRVYFITNLISREPLAAVRA